MNIGQYFTAETPYGFYVIGGAAFLLILIILLSIAFRPLPKKIADRIRKKDYMRVEDFLSSWKESKEDYPGCYVILIYDKKLVINPMHYDEIYVGQSVNVRKRLFSHCMGHGNGNVYYSLKSGCKVYVIIQKCSRRKLNRAEIDLIEYFNATKSLNMTRGGAPSR